MSVDPGASRVGKVNQGEAIVNRGERDPYLRLDSIWASVRPTDQLKNGITGKDDRTSETGWLAVDQ